MGVVSVKLSRKENYIAVRSGEFIYDRCMSIINSRGNNFVQGFTCGNEGSQNSAI